MLANERIKLRTIDPSDFDIIYGWENNPKYWSISGTQVPFSKALIEAYVNDSQDIYKVKQARFIIEDNSTQKVVGCIDLFDFDPFNLRAGIGILINDLDQKKGFAEAALKLIQEYSREHLQIKNLYCNILKSNIGSKKLFEKCGFKHVGTKQNWTKNQGVWEDEHLYQFEL